MIGRRLRIGDGIRLLMRLRRRGSHRGWYRVRRWRLSGSKGGSLGMIVGHGKVVDSREEGLHLLDCGCIVVDQGLLYDL